MNVLLYSVVARVRCVSFALGLFLLLANSVEAQPKKDSRLLTSRLERLAVSKAEYAKAQKSATDGVTNQFDEVISLVDRFAGVPADLRISLRHELRTARDRFQKDAEYTPILAFQESYETFAVATLKNRSRLIDSYERVLKLLPEDDSRRKKLDAEIESYAWEFAKFDSLKEGTTFVGY